MWKETEIGISVQLIDFEDVYAFDEVIPAEFVINTVKQQDKRYPIPLEQWSDPICASQKHNNFFFTAICRWARSDYVTYAFTFLMNEHYIKYGAI